MTTNQELCPRSETTSDVARPVMPILIQVPALRAPLRRPARVRTRRRRLRKEVRVAGLTMMSVLPVGLLLLALGGAQPIERPLPEQVSTAPQKASNVIRRDAANPPLLAIATPSVEASAPIPSASTCVPVVFRGYLLPAEGPEEPEYEGR
jgi:hypothetical protein